MFCGAVQAEPIASDVVGYNSAGLRNGGLAKGVGSMFLRVDGEDVTLGDLVVTGYEPGMGGETGVYCQLLDGYGRSLGVDYFWYDDGVKGEGTECVDWWYGWYSQDSETSYNDVVIPAGEGVWMYSPNTAFKIQSAGAVAKAPIAATLRSGGLAKMAVNPMPADLTFGDVWISGYASGTGGETGVYCQKLDGYGRSLGIDYFWYDDGVKDEGTECVDWWYGWYSQDSETSYNDVTLPAGEGIWVYSPSTSYKVNFKSPLN